MLGRDRGDLVLADERVAADQRRRRDHALPARLRAVVGIAPQRVVVAVRDRDVAERVDRGERVVRRQRMRLGNADARPQPGDPLVGDVAGLGHAARSPLANIVCRLDA